jgi:hypothetical protein
VVRHLYKDFLANAEAYRASEDFWRRRWEEILDADQLAEWSHPWISTGSLDLLDGNPIFSAFSPSSRRGVRIIQHEPTSSKVEIQAWPDFVGGNYYDPDVIQELVISCALSNAAADLAMSLIRPWVTSGSISFIEEEESGLMTAKRRPACSLSNDMLHISAA